MTKKRNAWTAGIAPFLAPGLGHTYAGTPKAGWLIVAGFLGAMFRLRHSRYLLDFARLTRVYDLRFGCLPDLDH